MKLMNVLSQSDMKHVKFIFLVALAIVVSACRKPSEEYLMREMVSRRIAVSGFTGFERYQTVTLADEVRDQIDYFNWSLDWDEHLYESFLEHANDRRLSEEERQDYSSWADRSARNISRDKDALTYLDSIDDLYPELYNEVSFTIYRLSYVAYGEDGGKIHDNCYAKFNRNGNMTAFRINGTSDWEILGGDCSVPGYERYRP